MPSGITLISGIVTGAPVALDAKFGPYNSITDALNDLTSGLRYRGLTVGVYESGVLKEYWFKDSTANTDFVAKNVGYPGYVGDYDNGASYAISDVVSTPVGSPYGGPGQLFIRVSNPGNPGYPPGTASWSSVYVADNDPRIANIAGGSIDTSSNGGSINTNTTDGTNFATIGPSDICTSGDSYLSSSGGFINTRGTDANGGNIDTSCHGSDERGGHIYTYSEGDDGVGGDILTHGGSSGAGGSLNLSNGGGSINTRGTGSIELGVSGTRTTLTGTATATRAISLPDASGTLGWLQSVSNLTLSGSHQLTAARNQRLVVNNISSSGSALSVYYPTSGNAEGDRLEIVHASQPNGGQPISVRTGPYDYTGAISLSLGYQRTFIYVSGSWIAGSVEAHTHPDPTPSFASSDFRVTEPSGFGTTNQLAFSLAGITAGSLRTLTIPNASGTISLTSHTHNAADITDSTAVGRSVLTAATQASARAAIGAASTSDVVLTGVVQLTQAQFNALTAPNATTLYIIIG